MLQREEHIPWQLSYEHDVVFCLSAHNVKISKRDGQEVNAFEIQIFAYHLNICHKFCALQIFHEQFVVMKTLVLF